jgi:hypothetical protein
MLSSWNCGYLGPDQITIPDIFVREVHDTRGLSAKTAHVQKELENPLACTLQRRYNLA